MGQLPYDLADRAEVTQTEPLGDFWAGAGNVGARRALRGGDGVRCWLNIYDAVLLLGEAESEA